MNDSIAGQYEDRVIADARKRIGFIQNELDKAADMDGARSVISRYLGSPNDPRLHTFFADAVTAKAEDSDDWNTGTTYYGCVEAYSYSSEFDWTYVCQLPVRISLGKSFKIREWRVLYPLFSWEQPKMSGYAGP